MATYKPEKKPDWTDKDEWTWKLTKSVLDATGGKHDEIKLREPTYGEIESAQNASIINGVKDTGLMVVNLIASISGKGVATVKNLPIRLFTDLASYIGHFI